MEGLARLDGPQDAGSIPGAGRPQQRGGQGTGYSVFIGFGSVSFMGRCVCLHICTLYMCMYVYVYVYVYVCIYIYIYIYIIYMYINMYMYMYINMYMYICVCVCICIYV